LASRDGEKARSWSAEFGIPKAYDSYEGLLADPEIEAVYIPLPNELHRPWVLAAAEAGKHVLCEKPLALDVSEAEAMAAGCRARGLVLMEAFMWRHQVRSAALRERVDSGAIGRLNLVRASFSFSIDPKDWRLDPARGGGALYDVGCYGVNAARFFTRSEPVFAQTTRRVGATGVDLTLTTALGFPGGVIGLVDCSFEQPFRCAYELVGTEGSIEVPDGFLAPERSTAVVRRKGSNASAGEVEPLSFDEGNQYARMVDGFVESVEAGRLVDPGEDGVAQMRALELVVKASRDV
jgi:predicted dehydrogenase